VRDINGRFVKGCKHPKEQVDKMIATKTKYTAEELKEHRKEWVRKNKANVKAKQQEWINNNRDKVQAWNKKSKKNHRARVYADNAKRRAEQLKRTPSWLTEDDLWVIKEFYNIAVLRSKTTGILHHVDHIIPLKGKTVSGLHVPINLQVITGVQNMKKNNRFKENDLGIN
jgi:hypothetical protein